jgi:hypothetical protein
MAVAMPPHRTQTEGRRKRLGMPKRWGRATKVLASIGTYLHASAENG